MHAVYIYYVWLEQGFEDKLVPEISSSQIALPGSINVSVSRHIISFQCLKSGINVRK